VQPEGWRQLPRAVMARRGWGMVWVAVAKVRLIHAACAHWSAALSVQLLESGGSQIAVAPSPGLPAPSGGAGVAKAISLTCRCGPGIGPARGDGSSARPTAPAIAGPLSVELLESGGSQIAVAPSPDFACTRRRGRRRQGDFVDLQVRTRHRTSTWRRLVGAASDPLQNWSIIGWAI